MSAVLQAAAIGLETTPGVEVTPTRLLYGRLGLRPLVATHRVQVDEGWRYELRDTYAGDAVSRLDFAGPLHPEDVPLLGAAYLQPSGYTRTDLGGGRWEWTFQPGAADLAGAATVERVTRAGVSALRASQCYGERLTIRGDAGGPEPVQLELDLLGQAPSGIVTPTAIADSGRTLLVPARVRVYLDTAGFGLTPVPATVMAFELEYRRELRPIRDERGRGGRFGTVALGYRRVRLALRLRFNASALAELTSWQEHRERLVRLALASAPITVGGGTLLGYGLDPYGTAPYGSPVWWGGSMTSTGHLLIVDAAGVWESAVIGRTGRSVTALFTLTQRGTTKLAGGDVRLIVQTTTANLSDP